MNIENAVRNLNDLSALDDELAEDDFPEEARRVELRDRRAALRGAMPEIVLMTYDALARSRRKPVVVAVRSAHCGGCYLRLPPQLDSAIRRRESLSVCPHCRRLLYPAPPPALRPPSSARMQRASAALSGKSRPKGRTPAAKHVGRPRASQERVTGRRRSAGVPEGSSFALELSHQRS